MTGALTLSGNPTASNHATTKGYVDSVVAGGGGLRAYSSSGVELGKTIILTANSIAVSFFIKMSDGKYARDVSTGNGVGSVYYPTTDCSGSVMYLSTEASMYRPVPPAGALVSANGGPLIDPRWTMSIYKTLPTGDVTHDLGSSPWFEVTSDEDTSLTMGLVLPLMSRKNYTIYQDPVTGVPCETATAADMWIDGSPLVRITPVTVFSSEMLNILEAYGPDGRAQITHESKR